MIDNDIALGIIQVVADKLAAYDTIDTDSIAVTAKRVRAAKKRIGPDGKAGLDRRNKVPGYQFTAMFAAHGIQLSEGFFLPESAEPEDYDINTIVAFIAEGLG